MNMAVWLHTFFFLLAISLSSSQSLHLRMIHRDSIHSPLYPGNLTSQQLLLRLADYSASRARYIESTLSLLAGASYNQTQIRPRVIATPLLYVVEVNVGTPLRGRHIEMQHLIMDTGSDLTWLQCEPCVNCWMPQYARYDPAKSSTFAPIPCSHPLCELHRSDRQCVNNQCHYTYEYATHGVSKGILATETLGFASDSRSTEFIRNIVFGCGRDNQNFRLNPAIAGIIGFNMKHTSFLIQASNHLGGRFAYCLYKFTGDEHAASLLRIGESAVLRGPNVKTVPFAVSDASHYYLPLADVSVAGRRLRFAPGTFRARKERNVYRGGFLIDSGTGATMFMHGGPYERVREAFIEYFRQFRLARASHPKFEVCYKIPAGGFTAYPSMTFHFENGKDFSVQPDNVVWAIQSEFCVVIERSNLVNIFGTYQQHNYRISYDTRNRALSYVPADCSADLAGQ